MGSSTIVTFSTLKVKKMYRSKIPLKGCKGCDVTTHVGPEKWLFFCGGCWPYLLYTQKDVLEGKLFIKTTEWKEPQVLMLLLHVQFSILI